MDCNGKRDGSKNCMKNYLVKCKKCGALGCDNDGCSNQVIKLSKCLKCGHNQYETLR